MFLYGYMSHKFQTRGNTWQLFLKKLPTLPSIRKTQHPNAVFSTCPGLSKKADDLIEGGFFYKVRIL